MFLLWIWFLWRQIDILLVKLYKTSKQERKRDRNAFHCSGLDNKCYMNLPGVDASIDTNYVICVNIYFHFMPSFTYIYNVCYSSGDCKAHNFFHHVPPSSENFSISIDVIISLSICRIDLCRRLRIIKEQIFLKLVFSNLLFTFFLKL